MFPYISLIGKSDKLTSLKNEFRCLVQVEQKTTSLLLACFKYSNINDYIAVLKSIYDNYRIILYQYYKFAILIIERASNQFQKSR